MVDLKLGKNSSHGHRYRVFCDRELASFASLSGGGERQQHLESARADRAYCEPHQGLIARNREVDYALSKARQVLRNLMINGIDAMKEVNGTRELAIKSLRAEHEQLLVSISDTGVGLPPHQTDHIFNAFFTTKLPGTGMGLSTSRSIVESHGGRLWAAGNSPRGTSFYLALPANVEARE
jgi:signal transduction histidine kinase